MTDVEQARGVEAWAETAEHANWNQRSAKANGTSVSVTVVWGDEVLLTRQVGAKAKFTLGTLQAEADFALGEEVLDATHWPLVQRSEQSAIVRLPLRASGFVEYPGESLITLEALRPKLGAIDSGHEVVLPLGARAVVRLGPVSFEVTHSLAEAPWARTLGADVRPLVSYFGASFVSAAALLAGMAFFVPPLGLNDGERIDSERIYLLQQYLDAAAERENAETLTPAANFADQAGGKDGAKAAGEEGAMGKPEAAKTSAKIAVKGPADNPKPELSPREQAATFGMIGLLAGGVEADGPSAPWARDVALGSDPLNAMGAMWGDELGENSGVGGLGLMGGAEGGGGRHQGIGLGDIGTLGTQGNCTGAKCLELGAGFGRDFGKNAPGHATKGLRVRMAEPVIGGRLPREVIQRIVRQNFGRLRQCYETGLSHNPNLQGRVQVRFMIDRGGAVVSVANGGSTLPDATAVSCVLRAFYGLSFPKPDAGSVQVSYPISFSPE